MVTDVTFVTLVDFARAFGASLGTEVAKGADFDFTFFSAFTGAGLGALVAVGAAFPFGDFAVFGFDGSLIFSDFVASDFLAFGIFSPIGKFRRYRDRKFRWWIAK